MPRARWDAPVWRIGLNQPHTAAVAMHLAGVGIRCVAEVDHTPSVSFSTYQELLHLMKLWTSYKSYVHKNDARLPDQNDRNLERIVSSSLIMRHNWETVRKQCFSKTFKPLLAASHGASFTILKPTAKVCKQQAQFDCQSLHVIIQVHIRLQPDYI